ncbi:hypothetical protein [Streptomyces sp. NPDC048002]|uniref:hypothetical protein n=1 Tax=unclassified Streptomyces TaxID=2593676 RepID=UPI0033D9A92F
MTSAPELTVIQASVSDPKAEPLIRAPGGECSSRYGRDAHAERVAIGGSSSAITKAEIKPLGLPRTAS